MSSWQLVDNPAFAGREPRPLRAACHDGTPFITIRCSACGETMHQHESRTIFIPDDLEIATVCPTCGEPLLFPAGFFRNAFAELRARGWLDPIEPKEV